MFRNLVVPLDGSDSAARALPIAAALARDSDAFVRVVGIVRPGNERAERYAQLLSQAERAGLDSTNVELRVDSDGAEILLSIADDERNVLCLAPDRHARPKFMQDMRSRVMERVPHPVLAVGPNASSGWFGTDVVVALDGFVDSKALLDVAAGWAQQLRASLRLVTVYEPVIAEPSDHEILMRQWGPPDDPNHYLGVMAAHAENRGLAGIKTAAIRDLAGPADGLQRHLSEAPARLLVMGRGHTAFEVLEHATVPLLLVNEHIPERN